MTTWCYYQDRNECGHNNKIVTKFWCFIEGRKSNWKLPPFAQTSNIWVIICFVNFCLFRWIKAWLYYHFDLFSWTCRVLYFACKYQLVTWVSLNNKFYFSILSKQNYFPLLRRNGEWMGRCLLILSFSSEIIYSWNLKIGQYKWRWKLTHGIKFTDKIMHIK